MTQGIESTPVNRRLFLRGLGASITLPAFASLGVSRLLAADAAPALATTATGAPLRSAFIYFPNGAIPAQWWPSTSAAGEEFTLSRTLQPLEPLKSMVQVLGGLNHETAEGRADGPGDHARGGGTFLTEFGSTRARRISARERRSIRSWHARSVT